MKPHKHSKEIHAWADGATIQYRRHEDDPWENYSQGQDIPWWRVGYFRVKPLLEPESGEWYLVRSQSKSYVMRYEECTDKFYALDGSWIIADSVTIVGKVDITYY